MRAGEEAGSSPSRSSIAQPSAIRREPSAPIHGARQPPPIATATSTSDAGRRRPSARRPKARAPGMCTSSWATAGNGPTRPSLGFPASRRGFPATPTSSTESTSSSREPRGRRRQSWCVRASGTGTRRTIRTSSPSFAAWRRSKLAAGARGGRREPVIDRFPVRVGQEGVDVLWALRRRVVQDEGVLPDVHHEDGGEARHIANLVQRHPVVGQLARVRILIADGPAYAAHLTHADEGRLPRLERAEALRGRLGEGGLGVRAAGRAALQIVEVVLMQDHAVVLEAEPPGDLGVGRHLFLVDRAVLEHLRELAAEPVRLRHVALVELEMHLEGLVRDTREPRQIPVPRLVAVGRVHVLPPGRAAQAAWSVRRRPCANRSSIARLNAGRTAGFRLETRLPSTTTSSSTHSAPAFRRSVFNDGQAPMRRPLAAPASMTIQGPWQIAATGLPASKKAFTNSTAFGCMRSASGFITPPGSRRASKSRACARSRATSTRTSLPHWP